MPVPPGFRLVLSAIALVLSPALAAQQADGTAPPADTPAAQQPRVNLMVTVPRKEINEAEVRQCRDEADAGTLSGEIVVCRELGEDTSALSGSRAETQKRYAQETMNQGKPAAPDMFGIPDNGKGIGFGKAPPPAITVDFAALPVAPAGSDADRIARGLAPLGQQEELTEEQERARREAQGIKTVLPPRPRKKGG